MRVALLQANLQGVVVRLRVRAEGVDDVIERGIAVLAGVGHGQGQTARAAGSAGPVVIGGGTARRERIRCIRVGSGLIAVVESEELQSARTAVGNFENGVGGQLVLQTEVPLLGVRRDQTRIERVELGRVRVAERVGGKALLQEVEAASHRCSRSRSSNPADRSQDSPRPHYREE